LETKLTYDKKMKNIPQDIALSAAETAELYAPYSVQEEMSALKLGFALALSEIGLTPSEFEQMVKVAEGISLNPVNGLLSTAEGLIGLTTMAAGGGALAGGYSGYLRHKVEKDMEGKGDPDLVSLHDKIRAYNELTRDLRRSNAVAA
jgi:hypothetical protein